MRSSISAVVLLAAVAYAAPSYEGGAPAPYTGEPAVVEPAPYTGAPAVVEPAPYTGEPAPYTGGAPVVEQAVVAPQYETLEQYKEPSAGPKVTTVPEGAYQAEATPAVTDGAYQSEASSTPAPDATAYGSEATSTPATDAAYGSEPAKPTEAATYKEGSPVKSTSTGKPAEYKCSVTDKGFEPKEMSVKKGDTVTFKMSAAGSLRCGTDASSCKPLPGVPTKGDNSTMTYTIPQDAAGKINFYSVQGDKCVEGDMMATFTVDNNLAANATAAAGSTSSDSSFGGIKISSASSSVPMFALVGAISFVSTLVQL